MRIQYQKGDPREGMVAEIEPNRAKVLIESGAAKKVGADVKSEPVAVQSVRSAAKSTKKAAAKKAKADDKSAD